MPSPTPPLPRPRCPRRPTFHSQRRGRAARFAPAFAILLAFAAVLALGAGNAVAEPEAATPETPPAGASEARAQSFPPAPPPTGIRPSRQAAERREQARREGAPLARRAESSALDLALVVEVRGMEQTAADAAILAAVETVRELEALVDLEGVAADGVAALNRAAGGEPVGLDPRLVEMLERGLSFCTWSQGAHGPLGGELYAVWGLRSPATSRPTPARLRQAVSGAACGNLLLDAASSQARLAAGTRVDPWGFATGWLVDGAVETLLDHGAEDVFVELGWVRRAAGSRDHGRVSGPLADFRGAEAERGWPVELPEFPGLAKEGRSGMAPVWLRGEAMSVASAVHRPLLVAGDRYAPWIDQREGVPAGGVVGVVAVTERAVDAQALAATMLILGNREGMVRAGALKPTPAVLWLLGRGEGRPVLSNYNWSEIALR